MMITGQQGARREVLNKLEPILHALVLETAAEGEVDKIGGKAEQVLAPGALTGADANMAMNQQWPGLSQPLFLFPTTMYSQRIPQLPEDGAGIGD